VDDPFRVACAAGHEFEGWFRSGDGFEAQQRAARSPVRNAATPGSRKRLMAPHIGRSQAPVSPTQLRSALIELRRQVETNCDYVGDALPRRPRRIHYGEVRPATGSRRGDDRGNRTNCRKKAIQDRANSLGLPRRRLKSSVIARRRRAPRETSQPEIADRLLDGPRTAISM